MSDGEKIPLAYAVKLAKEMYDLLEPFCERIVVAGSIRRKCAEVGDIEMVLIPKLDIDLLGYEIFRAKRVEQALRKDGYELLKNGQYYIQARLPGGKVTFDVFLTTPEKWGVNFTIRTGCAEFSHRLVTLKRYGGLLPSDMHVKDGRIWRGGVALDTPKEADVFRVIGLSWIPPEKRNSLMERNRG